MEVANNFLRPALEPQRSIIGTIAIATELVNFAPAQARLQHPGS